MASNTRSIVLWTTTIIVAGFIVFSLLPTSVGGFPTDDEKSAEYFLRCWRMRRPGVVDPDQNRYLDSLMNKIEVQFCRDSLLSLQFHYIINGTLPPGYVEALRSRYNNNQTLVDIRICNLDSERCPDETKALVSRYYDGLRNQYNNNQTLFDIHICVHGLGYCPHQTEALLRKYYTDGLDFTHFPDETRALLSKYYE